MFKTIRRIINWCGEFKGKLYIGFVFSFFSNIFAAMPIMVAAYTVGMLIKAQRGNGIFDRKWIGYSIVLILMLIFVFYSFEIFASVEPISDSAHVLSVIEDAMDQLDALKAEHYIDSDGKDIPLEHHDILFKNVDFGYTDRKVLKNVSFTIPEKPPRLSLVHPVLAKLPSALFWHVFMM